MGTSLTLVISFWMTVPVTSALDLDPATLSRLPPGTPLRWDNVKSSPTWIAGAMPCYDSSSRLYQVRLSPGAFVMLRLPARAMLRIVGPGHDLTPEDVAIWTGNGSGLYRRLQPAVSANDHSLVAAPGQSDPGIVRIERPRQTDCAIDLALFISRRIDLADGSAFQTPITTGGETVTLGIDTPRSHETWSVLRPQQRPLSFSVCGPIRLRIETRLQYAAWESVAEQPYQLWIGVDGVPRRIESETTTEGRRVIYLDGEPCLVSRPEVEYVDLAAGNHRVTLESTSCMLVRVLATLPGANPTHFARFTHTEARAQRLACSLWEQDDAFFGHALQQMPPDLDTYRQTILRSVRDNRYREGGLRAWWLLKTLASSHPEVDGLSDWAERCASFHTRYRNLLPASQTAPLVLRTAWCSLRQLRPLHDEGMAVVVADQMVEDAVRNLSRVHLVRFPPQCVTEAEYYLPDQLGPTQLRVVVDASCATIAAELWLACDDRAPVPLRVFEQPGITPADFTTTRAEAGLAAQYWKSPEYDAGTLGGPFARQLAPGDLVKVASTELTLPHGARRIRLICRNPTAGCLDVGLQYREGKHYELTESAYLQARQRATCEGIPLLERFQIDTAPLQNDSEPGEELRNFALPLHRWLTGRHQSFVADLVPPPTTNATCNLSGDELSAQIARARQLSEMGDWILALEAWSQLLPCLPASLRVEALRERTRALEQLQEPYLVERELRGMLCFDPDPVVRTTAARHLRERYMREADVDNLEALAATELLLNPTPDRWREVVRLLLQDGQWSLAIQAGLELPPGQQNVDDLLLAAHQLRWWQVFEQLRNALPEGESKNYWSGIWQLEQGQEQQAVQLLMLAGDRGQNLAAYLQAGRQIVSQLKDADPTTRLNGITAWENWQAQVPLPWIWQPDDESVIQCAGSANVYAVENDLYLRYYKATPDQPVWLELQGPVAVKLEARPLHPAQHGRAATQRGASAPGEKSLPLVAQFLAEKTTFSPFAVQEEETLHDDITIRGAGREHLLAVNNNRAAESLQIVDHPGQSPGYRVEGSFSLGPGRHRIQVAPARRATLIRVHVRRPVGLLPVLPPLTCQTVQAVLEGRYGMDPIVETASNSRRHNDLVLGQRPSSDVAGHSDIHDAAKVLILLPGVAPGRIPLVQPIGAICEAAENGDLEPLQLARWGLRRGRVDPQHVELLLAWAVTAEDPQTVAERAEVLLQYAADPTPWFDQKRIVTTPLVEQAVRLHRGQIEAALAVDPAGDLPATRQRLALLTRLAEADSTQRPRLLVLAAEQFDRLPWLSDMTGFDARLFREMGWSLYREVESSAGLHTLQLSRWSPESPGLRIRRCLLTPSEPADYLVTGQSQLLLRLNAMRATETQLILTRPQLSYLPAMPVRVRCQVGNQAAQVIPLDRAGTAQSVRIKLPAGDHQIQLRTEDPQIGQYVLVQVHDRSAPNDQQRWSDQPDAKPDQRLYQVATSEEPLRFRVLGPTRIRVDEWVGDSTRVRYFNVPDQERQFEFTPPPGMQASLFRVFQWSEETMRRPLEVARSRPLPPPRLPVWLDQLPTPTTNDPGCIEPAWFAAPSVAWGDPLELRSLAAADEASPWIHVPDAFPLGGQEKGTWSVALGAFTRRPVEEDFQAGAPDEFGELRVGYDLFDPWKETYTRTDTLVRLRESSGPTWGLSHQRWWEWPNNSNTTEQGWTGFRNVPNNLVLTWDLYGFLQAPAGALPPDDAELEGSLGTALRAYRRFDLTERLWHVPIATVFGRWLTLDEVRYQPGRVDQDVFTLYKSDHPTGLRVSDTWVHEPRVDTQFWIRPALVTNEDFNPGRPDHLTLQTGLATYLSGVVLDLSYRVTRYTNDDDRESSVTQQFIYCDAMLEHWQHAGSRYELGFSLRQELTEGETSASLVLTRYLSNGRGYRDVPPGSGEFLALRRQRHLGAWIQEYTDPN